MADNACSIRQQSTRKRITSSFAKVSFSGALIISLLLSSGPATVSQAVSKASVNSVDCMLDGWPGSHVEIEVRKRIFPSFANTYPAASIVGVFGSLWIGASLDYSCPYFVHWSPRFSMSSDSIDLEASTTSMFAHRKIPPPNDLRSSAITFTEPCNFFTKSPLSSNNEQSIKTFSGNVNQLRHAWYNNIIFHVGQEKNE
jgi:hypothetical protein